MPLTWFEIAGSGGGLVTVTLVFRFLNGRINRKVDTKTCDTHVKSLEDKQETDISHLKELIEKDLAHGRGRFDDMEKRLNQHGELLQSMDKSLAVIAKNGGAG